MEKQGINLGNIVISEKGSQVVVDSVKELFKDLSDDQLVKELQTIQDSCKNDLAQRVLATNNGAYSVLIKLTQSKESQNLQEELIKTLVSNLAQWGLPISQYLSFKIGFSHFGCKDWPSYFSLYSLLDNMVSSESCMLVIKRPI